MRIVLATLYGTVGGSSRVLMAAAEALRGQHEVIVRAPLTEADSRTARPLSSESLESISQKIRQIPRVLRSLLSEWAWTRKVRPDVIYVHDDLSLYVYGPIGKAMNVPIVWHVHLSEGEGWKRRLRDALCDAKIFVSQFTVGSKQPKPWRLVRNPVEIVVRPRPADHGLKTLGMIGRISRLKNQALGIRVLAKLVAAGQKLRLEIFGNVLDPGYQRELDALVREHGLERCVSFRGYIPMADALKEIDLLMSCSTYESFGLSVVEALGAGIPVVASDIEGHREIASLVRSEALSLVPLEPDAMAAAIRDAKRDDAAAGRVAHLFSYERFRSEIVDFFAKFESHRLESSHAESAV